MAQLKNTQFATFDRDIWRGKAQVTVGHNRTLQLTEDSIGQVLQFRLHGHVVCALWRMNDGRMQLKMDDCGYATNTTREAIKDAVSLFGFTGGVSFAKKSFTPKLRVEKFEWIVPHEVTSHDATYIWGR